jgi:Rrf2 family protein
MTMMALSPLARPPAPCTLLRLPHALSQALAILVTLARDEGASLSVTVIAQGSGVPVSSVEELVRALRAAGLIRSFRGRSGGYALTRVASEITVQAVAESVPDTATATASAAAWPARAVVAKLDALTRQVLESTTVAELAALHQA